MYNFPFRATENESWMEPITQASSWCLLQGQEQGGCQRGRWGAEQASISPGRSVSAASCIQALEVTGRRRELRPSPPPTSQQITRWELGSRPKRGQKEARRRQENEA